MITYFALNGSFDLVPAQLVSAIVFDLIILIVLAFIAYMVSVEIKESRAHKEHVEYMARRYGARFED